MKHRWDDAEDFRKHRMLCAFGITEFLLPAVLGLGAAGAAEGAAGAGIGSVLGAGAAEAGLGAGISELGLSGATAAGGEGLTPLVGEALPFAATPTTGPTPSPFADRFGAAFEPMATTPGSVTPTATPVTGPGPTGVAGAIGPPADPFAAATSNPLSAITSVPGEIPSGVAAPANDGLMGWLGANKGLATVLGLGAAGSVLGGRLGAAINPKPPGSDALNDLASKQDALSRKNSDYQTQLVDPLLSGKLPAGGEQSVQNAVNDAISTTKARYASLGLSGSTAESDAIANIQNHATAIRFQIAEQMAQTGMNAGSQALNALGLEGNIYQSLMQAQIAQDTALQNAIAQFASAAALGTGLASRRA